MTSAFSDDFAPFERLGGRPGANLLLLCDHASNALPPAYGSLGLPAGEFERHIAYDIGAAAITRRVAARLEAPALLSCYSRLLIDPNRGADDPTLVMRLSDGRVVPGNARIDAAEIAARRTAYWSPYRRAIAETLEAMLADGLVPTVVSIHTFTERWKGVPRPWEVGVLWDTDARLAGPLIAALREAGYVTGDNEPYDGALAGDTLDEEVTRRGLAGLLVEKRQDLVATQAAAYAFADRLADIMAPILARPDLRRRAFLPSRTGRHRAL